MEDDHDHPGNSRTPVWGFLDRCAYRIGIGWDILVISRITAGIVALLKVLYHSVKADLLNSADSLRYE